MLRILLLALGVVLGLLTDAHAVDLSLPPIVVQPPTGLPAEQARMLTRKTTESLAFVGFQTDADAGTMSLRLTGVAVAEMTPAGAHVTITWTVADPQGGVRTVDVEDTAPYQAKDAWQAVDSDTLSRLAETTGFALEAIATGGKMPAHAKFMTPPPPPKKDDKAAQPTGPATTRVFIGDIQGAPGDGNITLGRALIQFLAQFDVVILRDSEPGAYVITAGVATKPASNTEDQVTIVWRLNDTKGRQLAKITQQNKVPSGSLNPHWGSTAVYAAEGAADGLLSAIGQIASAAPPKPPAKGKKKP